MFTCGICNKQFASSQGHNAHRRHCKLQLQGKTSYSETPPESKKRMAWSKGLTKRDHPSVMKQARSVKKYTDEELFCVNSTAHITYIRRAYQSKVPYLCSKCGNNGEWNGSALILQTDHINGDERDNRLENLRLLCPNCHSQTPTFGGRNRVYKK